MHDNYEVAFIEYTERGNVFSNGRKRAVFDKLREYDKDDLAVIVFVHGWKDNANPMDGKVKSFREALNDVAKSNLIGKKRRLVGLYVGWRGLSLHGLGLENLTLWDRKAVAQKVGKGGVTDLFVEFDNIDQINSNNYLFIIEHSFGGAITLSALNEVFLERVKSSHDTEVALNGFGEGTEIINPAIEANQILQLKEADQLKLLNAVSSKGDVATHRTFLLGQALGVLAWKHEDLERNYFGTDYTLSEYKLDINTAELFTVPC